MSFHADVHEHKDLIIKHCGFVRIIDGELFNKKFSNEKAEIDYRESLTDSQAFDEMVFSDHDVLLFLLKALEKLEEL